VLCQHHALTKTKFSYLDMLLVILYSHPYIWYTDLLISYSSILMQPLLSFVNFRLYHSINLKYPPILDPRLEALAAGTIFLNLNGIMKI